MRKVLYLVSLAFFLLFVAKIAGVILMLAGFIESKELGWIVKQAIYSIFLVCGAIYFYRKAKNTRDISENHEDSSS